MVVTFVERYVGGILQGRVMAQSTVAYLGKMLEVDQKLNSGDFVQTGFKATVVLTR